MKVDSFTVSYSMETFKNGQKSSHFLSASMKLDDPVSMDEFPSVQLHAAYKLSISVVYDALMRGAMTLEEANSKISDMKQNYEAMREKLENPKK